MTKREKILGAGAGVICAVGTWLVVKGEDPSEAASAAPAESPPARAGAPSSSGLGTPSGAPPSASGGANGATIPGLPPHLVAAAGPAGAAMSREIGAVLDEAKAMRDAAEAKRREIERQIEEAEGLPPGSLSEDGTGKELPGPPPLPADWSPPEIKPRAPRVDPEEELPDPVAQRSRFVESFRPPELDSGPELPKPPPPFFEGLGEGKEPRLEGVLLGREPALAIVSGEILKVGDAYLGTRVEKITRESVVFRKSDETRTIELPK